ncbi:MAG: tRNA uridine-5-carboxymethylaminomethyl(34) synthesis GTPase MnmE [Proteobacteria bacterium]|nr:tRNA uridine-5-carboxymethylaminomethyl(34) synthesis GTPase MnmE [Pseudomonadota bacterium]
MHTTDTIAAIATAPGAGGIGIVRLSGPDALRIGAAVCRRRLRPRRAHRVVFKDEDGTIIDDGIALAFPAPRSYSGEDVVELQAHGSPVVLDLLLRRCLALGARMARPGEFSERAYHNGRLDLAQAEAVADLIAAGSLAAARAARRSLDGAFSRRVDALQAALTALRVQVEAAIDFPEEELDFLADAGLSRHLDDVCVIHAALLADAARGQRLRDGLHVVIAGLPNAGKSSLLNALAGAERAIVTPQAGTTRDLLREAVRIDGIELTLVDTAGLHAASDAVEIEGIRRAREELASADLVLAVVDATDPTPARTALTAELASAAAILWLYNKADLVPEPWSPLADGLWICARSGSGLDALRERLKAAAGLGGATQEPMGGQGAFSTRARHLDALRRVGGHLDLATQRLRVEKAGELTAEELRLAQQALGEITGGVDSEALLGEIFAGFCIGK